MQIQTKKRSCRASKRQKRDIKAHQHIWSDYLGFFSVRIRSDVAVGAKL